MSMPGPYELIIILLIVLLLFGGRKIPEIARGIGKGIREFRKARDEVLSAVEDEDDEEEKPAQESRRIETRQPDQDNSKTRPEEERKGPGS